MKREFSVDAALGPLLVFDEGHRQAWSGRSFLEFVVRDGFRADVVAARCAALECDGLRGFEGSVELLVDEPRPEHARWAVRSSVGHLQLPTGRLCVAPRGALVSDRDDVKDEVVTTLELLPGDCEVELFAYVPHEVRLEDRDAPLPGEPPWGPASRVSAGLRLLAMGLTPVSLCLAWLEPRWLFAAVAGWAAALLFHRLSGEHRREVTRARIVAEELARLPALPDFTICVRTGVRAPAEARGASVLR